MIIEMIVGAVLSVLGGEGSQLSRELFQDRRFRKKVVGYLAGELQVDKLRSDALTHLLADDQFWLHVDGRGDAGVSSGLEYRLVKAGLDAEGEQIGEIRKALRSAVVRAVFDGGSDHQKFLTLQSVEQLELLRSQAELQEELVETQFYLLDLVRDLSERSDARDSPVLMGGGSWAGPHLAHESFGSSDRLPSSGPVVFVSFTAGDVDSLVAQRLFTLLKGASSRGDGYLLM